MTEVLIAIHTWNFYALIIYSWSKNEQHFPNTITQKQMETFVHFFFNHFGLSQTMEISSLKKNSSFSLPKYHKDVKTGL